MPGDYVSELAEQAFKKIAGGAGEEIVVILQGRPQDAATLANQLISRPDLQAQVASLAGYTPANGCWSMNWLKSMNDVRRWETIRFPQAAAPMTAQLLRA